MRLTLTALALLAAATVPVAAQTAAPAETEAPADLASAPPPTTAPAGAYAFDPEHSHIVWSYEHNGFSTSTGLVRGLTGTITLDPADPGSATVEASFPLSALRTVSAALDQHMMGADFFDGAAPDSAITFTSTAVEVTGDQTAKVTGDLTLNRVTKPVTLDVMLRQMAENPITGKPAAGFQATGTLLRSDFGLGAFAPAVSDEVRIEVNVEAQKG